MSSNNWQYDAFISYHDADSQWVWDWLIPRLKRNDISICTKDNFDIGIPKLRNIENALAASRYIVLVLTSDWVRDDWTQFDGLIIQYEDPIGLRQRTLPLLLHECALPRGLAMLTPADFTRSNI